MARFAQNKKKRKEKIKAALSLGFSLLLLILLFFGVGRISENTTDKQMESLESALNRSIIQCYAVEGTYPPSLDYIKEHYGLTYDEDLFFVDYTIVGTNLMPDITIIRKD